MKTEEFDNDDDDGDDNDGGDDDYNPSSSNDNSDDSENGDGQVRIALPPSAAQTDLCYVRHRNRTVLRPQPPAPQAFLLHSDMSVHARYEHVSACATR